MHHSQGSYKYFATLLVAASRESSILVDCSRSFHISTTQASIPSAQPKHVAPPLVITDNPTAAAGLSATSVSVQSATLSSKINLVDNVVSASSQPDYGSQQIAEIMSWVNHFDVAYHIPRKTWAHDLFISARKAGVLNKGVNENHYFFPGTLAQVIINGLNLNDSIGYSYAPYENFQAAYMDWLCEVPTDPQLHGQCPHVLSVTGEDVAGQTGHHAILTSPDYTKIGCSFVYRQGWKPQDFTHGLWTCNLR